MGINPCLVPWWAVAVSILSSQTCMVVSITDGHDIFYSAILQHEIQQGIIGVQFTEYLTQTRLRTFTAYHP